MVSANYPPCIGGPAATVPIIAENLVNLGHEVHVLTQGVKNYKDKKTSYKIIRTGTFSTNRDNFLDVLKLVFSLSKKIRELSKTNNYGVIHSHDLNISSLSVILSGINIKKVSKFTGDLALEYYCKIKKENAGNLTLKEFYSKKSILKTILKFVQQFIVDRIDLITAPSNFIKNELIKYSSIKPSKIIILRNGAKQVNAKKEKRDKNKLFCALKLEPKKNTKDAILSLKNLPSKYYLVIAGEGSEELVLKNLVKKEGLTKRVKFLGFINHEQVINELLTSYAFILPSVYEPASVSLYDAMSTYTPIIATKVGGTPEIIRDGKEGLLVRPFSSKDIAHSVLSLQNNKLYKNIQNNQEKTIKKYYWSNIVKKELITIYKKL